MATIKYKDFSNQKAKNAEKIKPVIVIDGYTLRPVKQASTAFAKRTFFVSLYTNVNCSFSELNPVARKLANMFRYIIHNDVAYQQKMDNLPSFVGVRNICFAPLNNGEFNPYICVELDNLQAAVFITRSWCKRTGQLPHLITFVKRKGQGVEAIEYETHKSSPLLIESLIQANYGSIIRLGFGGAVRFDFERPLYNMDMLPIQGTRVSQSFGSRCNVHTHRKIKRIYEAKHSGHLERLRRESSRSVAYIEYQEARSKLISSHIHRSQYGAAEIFGIGTRYARARDNYRRDTYYDAARADGIGNPSELAYTPSDRQDAERLGVVLPPYEENFEQPKLLVEVKHVEVLSKGQIAQRKRRYKEALKENLERKDTTTEPAWDICSHVEVADIVAKIKEVCDVEVEKNGQIVLKF